MSDVQAAPRLRKWPFYLADLALSAIAVYVLVHLGAIQGSAEVAVTLGCLVAAAWGAWISITPWLVEHRTQAALSESENLKSSLEQIQSVEKVAEQIRQANSQWQTVQDASSRTVNAAQEIAERMKVETNEFMKFIERSHDQERAGLRLEVEKLRRMEGDWIKVSVQMLDHVYALNRAAERSGQQPLINQLSQFQNACRDSARRMGLTPFTPAVREKFDSRAHQLPDAQFTPSEDAKIGDILATGFTYQGQLLRRALVLLENPETAPIRTPIQTDAPAGEDSAATESANTVATETSEPAKRQTAQDELPLS